MTMMKQNYQEQKHAEGREGTKNNYTWHEAEGDLVWSQFLIKYMPIQGM